MGKLANYRTYIKRIIQKYGAELPISEEVETQYIFDVEHDHYQLFQVGWDKHEWTHACIIHLDIKNEKIWIQHNGTEIGIAEELVASGVPKEDIVLGFQAPYKRKKSSHPLGREGGRKEEGPLRRRGLKPHFFLQRLVNPEAGEDAI